MAARGRPPLCLALVVRALFCALGVDASSSVGKPWSSHKYLWTSPATGSTHAINYATAGCGEPVILCHGFGGSVDYWRALIPGLASQGFKVYAVDFLGFGASDKPTDEPYSIELWRDLVLDFHAEFVNKPAVLVGNSIGSLVAANAAAAQGADEGAVKALALLNCAGGMNNKCIFKETDRSVVELFVARIFLGILDAVLGTPALLNWAFSTYSSEENIRTILQSVYVNKERVDDELVRAILAPAAAPTAPEVFGAILSGDPGERPESVMDRVSVPALAIWGDEDTFTSLNGPMGRYFTRRAEEPGSGVHLEVVNTGHVPHDDDPEQVLDRLVPFLQEQLKATRVDTATA